MFPAFVRVTRFTTLLMHVRRQYPLWDPPQPATTYVHMKSNGNDPKINKSHVFSKTKPSPDACDG